VNVLVGDCFLHDLIREPSRTLARVSEAISELHQAGLVWRYAANGKQLLYVAFWEDIQRIDKAQAGRNPRPDGTLNYKESRIREVVASPREPSRLEQGNRGTEDQGTEEQGGPSAPPTPSPNCTRHPEGTDRACASCKQARIAWENTQPKNITPIPARYGDRTGECTEHAGYPMPCARCAREAEETNAS
jgi:hypothetical protein